MLRSSAALAAGLLLAVLVFVYGTETRVGGTIDGHRLDCGPPISTSWLVSGTPDVYDEVLPGADDQRRAAAVCEPLVAPRRTGVIGMMVAAVLLGLIGWTSMRPRRDSDAPVSGGRPRRPGRRRPRPPGPHPARGGRTATG